MNGKCRVDRKENMKKSTCYRGPHEGKASHPMDKTEEGQKSGRHKNRENSRSSAGSWGRGNEMMLRRGRKEETPLYAATSRATISQKRSLRACVTAAMSREHELATIQAEYWKGECQKSYDSRMRNFFFFFRFVRKCFRANIETSAAKRDFARCVQ